MVMITEHNVYCGTEQPQEVIKTSCTKIVNEGIYSRTVENDDGTVSTHWWITTSTKYIDDKVLSDLVQFQADNDDIVARIIEKIGGL